MNLIGLMVARNEAWVISASARAALHWCDSLVVLCHACTDATISIVENISAENPGRVCVLVEDGNTWSEMAHRQRTLDEARLMGATHCAVVDADEIICGDTLPHVRDAVFALPKGRCLGIPMRNMHRSLYRFRSDPGIWGQRAGTMLAFADSPELCWRSADGYDHHHRHPYGSRSGRRIEAGGGVMHLQFASWRRLTAKHRWYKMTERVRWPEKSVEEIDRLYSMALDEQGAETSPAPDAWWSAYGDLVNHIDLDAEPWQEAECERLEREYGADYFVGLNLFHEVAV